ncbi:UNVERIFIED_CONTAM: hypothetical protein K2H54_050243 [Gekko kuhli]
MPLLEENRAWQECRLAQQVNEEVPKWIQVNQRARKRSKKKRRLKEDVFQKLGMFKCFSDNVGLTSLNSH